MSAHARVRDELVRVIQTGGQWTNSVSVNHAGGAPGNDNRPHTFPSGGSQNWNNMAWVGEGLGKKGYGAIDTWHRCALQVTKFKGKNSNSIGLFNTEVGSSIYNRWTAASTFLAAVPDQRRKCARPPKKTMELARRVNAAYVAFFTLHAIKKYPRMVHCFLDSIERDEKGRIANKRKIKEFKNKIEKNQPLPWVVAAQNRGVAKNNAARWPHCSNPNGWWLALALDWPGRVVPKRPVPRSADWWIWAMQEIAQKGYGETWPAGWFGLTERDRGALRRFIETDGKEGQETLLRLGQDVAVRRQYRVKRWDGRLISWIPKSTNGNNPAALAVEWCNDKAWVYAPSKFYTGNQREIDPGNVTDKGTTTEKGKRYCICDVDEAGRGEKLKTNPYPDEAPTINFQWSQQKGLKRLGPNA